LLTANSWNYFVAPKYEPLWRSGEQVLAEVGKEFACNQKMKEELGLDTSRNDLSKVFIDMRL
jgi:hypothetical protein